MREPQLRSMRDRLLRRLLHHAAPAAIEPAPVAVAVATRSSLPARVNQSAAGAAVAVAVTPVTAVTPVSPAPVSVPVPVAPAGAPVAVAVARGRVLLVTGDRRFRQLAATLLSQRGHDVILPDSDDDLAALARRERADAVVIDASASLTATARQVARLRGLRPPVGVVAVGAESGLSLAALPVLPKWSSFDEALAAVDRACATARAIREDA